MWKLAGLLSGTALVVMTLPAILLTLAMTGSKTETVTGTVRFAGGEVDLPLGACVEVVLVDVSAEDKLARPLGRQVIEDANTLPIDFRVPYEADRLTPGSTHELWVAVRHDGQLLYAAEGDYPVELGRTVSGIDLSVGPLSAAN